MSEVAAPARLLVVDDEEAISFALTDYLCRCGYEVDRARTRQEAEKLLAERPRYALVIADLRLSSHEPRGGLELLRRVRQRSPESRMILLTAYGSSDVEAEMAKLSDVVLLSKPQPLLRLGEEVARLLTSPLD
jgi:DNA-binding NtrC family response regulator